MSTSLDTRRQLSRSRTQWPESDRCSLHWVVNNGQERAKTNQSNFDSIAFRALQLSTINTKLAYV